MMSSLKSHSHALRRMVVLAAAVCTPLLTGLSTASARDLCFAYTTITSSFTALDCTTDSGQLIAELTMPSAITASVKFAPIDRIGCWVFGYDLTDYEAGAFAVNQGEDTENKCFVSPDSGKCSGSEIKTVNIQCSSWD